MKILDKYIEVIEEGYCNDCNELNCIGNFPQEKIVQEIKKLQQENQQLKEKLNCKEYFSSTMPEDTEFVILTKNNYDRQQKDLALENIKLKKQKDEIKKYIKSFEYYIPKEHKTELLRMLGEIDNE